MPETLYDQTEIEYLDGQPHQKVSPKTSHALVQAALLRLISECAGDRGEVLPELRLDPGEIDGSKTEFVPDVAFISEVRLQKLDDEQWEKPPFSPDIAVEVRSPSDDLNYLARKIARYLATGSVLVLDVDPKTRRIVAHTSDGARTYEAHEEFAHPVMPWLRFPCSAVFKGLRPIV